MAHQSSRTIPLDRPRAPITAGEFELIRSSYLNERMFPLAMEPSHGTIDLIEWSKANRQYLDAVLSDAGAILFRNFNIDSLDRFRLFIQETCGTPLEYHERSSPRTHLDGNVYTSTDYPAERSIFPHSEQSYNHTFPLRIAFFCMTAPKVGGETPIADTRRVLARIDTEVRRRFEELEYLYIRNFNGGMGLSWEETFQTHSRSEVEAICQRTRIECEWLSGGRLRTRQRRPAIAVHPSGVKAWFNHVAFFHVSSLEPEIYKQVTSCFSEPDFPNNTYYGDGSRIEAAALQRIREAYLAELVSFSWQNGDILLLDNMLTAHGRAPYTPPRKIAVAMARPLRWDQASVQFPGSNGISAASCCAAQ